jgi:N-acetylglucosamine malate deacetylase 1
MRTNRSILVVAAHPDDEVLGCGGTIAKHIEQGDQVEVVILAEGITSRGNNQNQSNQSKALSELAQAAKRANEILGVKKLTLNGFPDNRMDSMDRIEIIKYVEDVIRQCKPEIIYTHHAGDLNVDHRRTHESVVTASRIQPGCGIKTLLFFEVASSTEWQTAGSAPYFMPNWFVDISSTLDKKLNALKAYAMEMREWPHPRSIRALQDLSRWRGTCVASEAAEAFMLGRHRQ